jgi:hypothetical protein
MPGELSHCIFERQYVLPATAARGQLPVKDKSSIFDRIQWLQSSHLESFACPANTFAGASLLHFEVILFGPTNTSFSSSKCPFSLMSSVILDEATTCQ